MRRPRTTDALLRRRELLLETLVMALPLRLPASSAIAATAVASAARACARAEAIVEHPYQAGWQRQLGTSVNLSHSKKMCDGPMEPRGGTSRGGPREVQESS